MFLMEAETLIKLLHFVISHSYSIEGQGGPNRVFQESSIEEEVFVIPNAGLELSLVLIQFSKGVSHVGFLLDISSLHSCSSSHSHVLQTVGA